MPDQTDALLSEKQPQLQLTQKKKSQRSNRLLISSLVVAADDRLTIASTPLSLSTNSPDSSRLMLLMPNLSRLDDETVRVASTGPLRAGISQPSIWRYSPVWTLALSIAYLVVFFLGLVGNLSVLWVIFILRRNSRQSMFATCNKVFNGLIGNLALADLLVIIFCLPATLISNIFTRKLLSETFLFVFFVLFFNKLT